MSKKYLNERWCIRCGKTTPTPYLKKNEKLIRWLLCSNGAEPSDIRVLDIGCGNGRNSKYLKRIGYNVTSIDMAGDYGLKRVLGKDSFPNKKYELFLANYVFMFLSPAERMQVIREIERTAAKPSVMVLEMYPAKDAYDYDFKAFLKQLLKRGWVQMPFSAQKDKAILTYGGRKS